MKITKGNVRKLGTGLIQSNVIDDAETGHAGALAYCQVKIDDALTPTCGHSPRPRVLDYAGACACEDYPCCGHGG